LAQGIAVRQRALAQWKSGDPRSSVPMTLDEQLRKSLADQGAEKYEESENPNKELPAEEQARYTHFYNQLYPRLKDTQFDFHQVADKTGFKERRIREILLYRLSSGEIMQLFGRRVGVCYICHSKMETRKEPVCLRCLQSLDIAIKELYPEPFVLVDTSDLTQPLAMLEGYKPEILSIPRQEYEQLLHENQYYRNLYGPPNLATASPLEPDPVSFSLNSLDEPLMLTALSPEAILAAAANAAAETSEGDSQPGKTVLQILNAKEEELLAINEATDSALQDLPADVALRQYGFQRLVVSRG
jgi:hypothetical protein